MAKFKVIMKEVGSDHEIEQHACCDSRQQVIDWYGLDNPDIEYYNIIEEE